MYPNDAKYSKDHERIKTKGDVGLVGITDFDQAQIGDVVFVELPDVGRTLKQGEIFGSIESVKAVSELFTPASGEVVAVNTTLADHPEVVNKAPHDTWMIQVKLSNPSELDSLLDAEAYEKLLP